MTTQTSRATLGLAIGQLRQSERGDRVVTGLLDLLDAGLSGLGEANRDALRTVIEACWESPSTVRDLLYSE